MAKISELPVAGPLTGAEPIMVVQDGAAKLSTIGAVVSEAAQPFIDLAADEADRADLAADAAAAEAAKLAQQQAQADWDVAQRMRSLFVPPAWNPTRVIRPVGNSLSANVGSTIQFSAAMAELVAAGAANPIGANIQVGAGTNMATMLAYVTANTDATSRAQDWIVTDPITVGGTSLVDGSALADFEAIKALQTGGAESVLMAVSAPNDGWGGTSGPSGNSRYFFEAAQAKSYSADVMDVRQHMIDWYSSRTGIDALLASWNEKPTSMMGLATPVDLPVTSFDAVTEDPKTLDHYNGEVIYDSNLARHRLYVHVGAFGAGTNPELDGQHPPAAGRRVQARLVRDWDQGRQGYAPFIPPGRRFRTTENVAAGTVIGTVRTKGTADSLEIVAGDPLGSFSLRNIGGGAFQIVRSNTGSGIRQGEHKLLINAVKGAYQRPEFVRVMVMGPSGARVPTPIAFNKRFEVKGITGNLGSIKKFSMALRIWLDTLAASYFFYLKGAGNNDLYLWVNSDGQLQMNAHDAANALVVNAKSQSSFYQTPIAAGAWMNILFAADWENDLYNARLNGANLSFAGTSSSNASINSPVDLTACTPIFGATQAPLGFWPGAGTWTGKVQMAAMWPGTYIDWSVHESSVFNPAHELILADPAYTVNGVASHPLRIRGPVADLFAGGQDPSYVVRPTWRPADFVDL